jgi:hypothetical protein
LPDRETQTEEQLDNKIGPTGHTDVEMENEDGPGTKTYTEEDNDVWRRRVSAELEQLRCLIFFIDGEIKTRQENLITNQSPSVPFANVSMLFSPGKAVISKDRNQVYRVIRITRTRHQVKRRTEMGGLDSWKDDGNAVFDNDPIFIDCIHLDFDGKSMGPVPSLFAIPRYDGEKEVTSLPIFPLTYVEDGLVQKLTERGKTFCAVASTKHMHYTGLALETRDDIDSQVVVDFEEAIDRHPRWRPGIASILEDGEDDLPYLVDDNTRKLLAETRKSVSKGCISACCFDEVTMHEEFIDDQEQEDYIESQHNAASPRKLPITLLPFNFRDVVGSDTLSDDEYLIMSDRVFGFVLQSRKWRMCPSSPHPLNDIIYIKCLNNGPDMLNMENIFEIATLGAGEGFDELVLPPGHGNMVKSMIRQHLRDKDLLLRNRDKVDVVRGKGTSCTCMPWLGPPY